MTAVAPLSPVSVGTGLNNDRADIFITSAKTHVTRSLERTRSLRSWQKPSEEEGSEIQEAAQIVEILKRRVAFLSGGVDKKGRPILSIPVCPRVTLEDLAAVLKYLGSLLSEDSRDLGFIVIIDGHGEGWKQLKTSFIAVHTSLEDFVSAVYVIKPDGLLDRQKPVDLKKEKLFLDFQPQYITLKNLHKLISPSQLTSDFGGTYSYDHEQWLHKRLALERYLKASTAVLRHLDTSCVLLNTHTRNLTQDNMADALQHLRKFYDNVMTAPNTALKNGQDLLEQLEMDLNSGFKTLSGNEPPEEILIAQNQVRNKIKEIQSQEEKFTLLWRDCQHHIRHVADFMEFETGVKEVTEWILGSGDKMLSFQDDIGESLLRSEELLQEHSDLEISCTKTYGQYAELRHKAENMLKREHPLSKEIEAQRNYMDNVCRAFASRLERRRSLLTASMKFHRLLDEDFKKTEDVRKMLLTDKEITDTHEVQLIDTQLHHAFNRLVSEKAKVPKESHRLLDLILTSLKHTSGKDTSPKTEWIKFHVQYNLEKVEQQKQELLDVIKLKRLKLEQVTQLLRCEEDAEQSIQWLQDLTELMVNTHIQLGRSVQEVESIRLEHQKFEETAKGTYDYGRQLLETALQIRRSCQYSLQPNSQLANRLFTTWRVFLQGSQERATRLSVCWRFHKNFLNVMEKLVQLEDGLQEEFKSFGWIRKNWIVRRYKERWIKVVTMLTNTICMARALLTRMVKPVVNSGVRADKYLGDEAAAEVIRRKMEEGEKKATDVERKFFDENASLIRSELAKSGSLSQDEDSWAHTSSCTEDWWSCASNGTSGEDWKSADESQSDGTRFRAKTRYPSLTIQAPLNSQCGKLSEEEKKWTQTKETQEMSQIQYTKEMSEACTTTKFSFQHVYETRQPQSLNAAAQTTAPKLPERSKFWPSIDKKKGPSPQTDDTKRGQEVVRLIEKTNKTDVDYTDPLLKKMTESKEWMQLKIQEIYPSMTEVGSTLEEAMELQQQHEQVLEKLQTKQSPVEELLNQADELISNQKPKAEVYAAMADNLGLAWKDLNAQLEQRRQILEQAVNFYSRASEFVERMDVTQKETFDSYLPSDTESCKLLLQQHHDAKKGMLEASMHTLNEGQSLLECLREVGIHSMGDSRPEHMRHAAQQACIRIECYMESLHDKRRSLEAQWLKRKTQLEQCLQLCLLYSDMDQVENWVKTKGKEYLKQNNLGDSAAGAEILLHEHQKALTEAKEAQDRAVRLLKTAEQLANSGHYASEEIKTRGYTLLSDTSEILASLDQRKEHLSMSLSFFNMAQTALNKLDQIEVQLTTIDLPRSSAALVQQHAQLAHAIEDITSPALHEGHVLLQRVGRNDSGATGVARKIAELEDRRHHLSSLCTAHRAENLERSAAFTNFCEKYEILYNWILSAGLAFLQGHQDMGSVLSMAKHFLQEHERLQNEAQMKGIEVQALLSIIPPLLSAGDEEAEAVQQKAKNLRYQWSEMKSLLENRIKLSQHYVSFHKLAVQLANEMDVVEEMIREKEPQNESIMKQMEEKWMACQQIFLQLNNTGKNFIENATQVDDKHLDTKRAILCVETILEDFKTRKEKLSNLWMSWQTQVSAGKEQKIHWEQFLKDAQKTIESAKDMQEKLYPIIPRELNNAETIAEYLEKYQTISVPTAKRVLMEVEMRLKTAETIQVSPSFQNQKDSLVNQFTKLHQELNNKIAEFHVLLTMMVTLFHNFVELEKLVEKQEVQYVTAVLPSGLDEMERMMREHDASKPTILELFKFTANEAQQVINKISQVEPLHVAPKDTEKIKMVDGRKKHFETAWEEHKRKLEQQYQFCLFNRDLQQINYQLSELSKHLEDMRGNYGESLPGANATSQAFVQFEKTIELLEKRIQTFISTAEKMLIDQHAESSHIKTEIHSLQNKWSTFHMNIGENRRLIDLSIEYFSLIEEADEWFKEGSTILVSIARKSTSCKSPNDANNLLDEVRNFLKPGEVKQDERLRKISTLATQLYGLDHTPMSMQQVSGKNKEMLESFSVINDELSSLAESLKEAEQERERQKKEKEEADAAVKAAQAEAAAAKAAAAAAQEAVKAAQAAAKAVPVKPVPLAKVTIDQQEAVPIPIETQNAHIEITKPLQFDVPKPKAPVFVVPLIDAEVMEGSKYTFICQVDGFPQPEVQWFKDSILIQNNPDYQTTYVDGMCTLTIEETFTEDSARFSCKAVNPAGTAETQGLLTVNESRPHEELIPPHFTQELQDGVVQEGKSFQFECVVVGNPLPLVSWFKNDICIDNSPDYAITNNNGQCTLKIEEAYLEDESRYTCRAANQAGQVACSAKLTVKPLEAVELPKFLTPLSNVMARAGQKLRLECRVQGQPEPVLSWFHNGKPITNREMHYDGNKATLFIIEAFPKDAGTYMAVAKNQAGEATSSCNVLVKGRLPMETSDSELASDMEPVKPKVMQPLKNLTVGEGSTVRMDCIIVGQPEPEVIWYHNEKPVKESNDIQLLFEGDKCSLIIHEAYLEDAGTYKCVAINSGGEASSTGVLTVESLSEVSDIERSHKDIILSIEKATAPKFSKLLMDTSVIEGQRVKLECQVTGEPQPFVSWYKDGKQIDASNDYQITHDNSGLISLTIPEVFPEDGGSYTVKATNKAGEAKCFCTLSVSPKKAEPKVQYKPSVLQFPPKFTQHLMDTHVGKGKEAKFECNVTGTPKPKIQWCYKGWPITADKDHKITADGDKHCLVIPTISSFHSGRYSITAENPIGKATSSALLVVEEPFDDKVLWDGFGEPKIQSMVMMKKTTMMQTSTLSKSGGPQENGGYSISQSSAVEEHGYRRVGEALPEEYHSSEKSVVHEVDRITPTKTVVTTAVLNMDTPAVTTGPAAVWGKTSTSTPKYIAPRFLKPVSSTLVEVGEKVYLEGQIEGNPEPTVKWFKNNLELHSKPEVLISLTKGKASLLIPKATESDSGRYSCSATNEAGQATSTAEVVVKPHRVPPKFIKRLQACVVKAGEKIELDIEVAGDPLPEVTWYRNNELVKNSPDFRLKSEGSKHSLVIPEAFPDDACILTVKATNCVGEAQSTANLIVEEDLCEVDQKVTYKEFSVVEQKKELVTKVSVAQSAGPEPLQLPSVTAPPSLPVSVLSAPPHTAGIHTKTVPPTSSPKPVASNEKFWPEGMLEKGASQETVKVVHALPQKLAMVEKPRHVDECKKPFYMKPLPTTPEKVFTSQPKFVPVKTEEDEQEKLPIQKPLHRVREPKPLPKETIFGPKVESKVSGPPTPAKPQPVEKVADSLVPSPEVEAVGAPKAQEFEEQKHKPAVIVPVVEEPKIPQPSLPLTQKFPAHLKPQPEVIPSKVVKTEHPLKSQAHVIPQAEFPPPITPQTSKYIGPPPPKPSKFFPKVGTTEEKEDQPLRLIPIWSPGKQPEKTPTWKSVQPPTCNQRRHSAPIHSEPPAPSTFSSSPHLPTQLSKTEHTPNIPATIPRQKPKSASICVAVSQTEPVLKPGPSPKFGFVAPQESQKSSLPLQKGISHSLPKPIIKKEPPPEHIALSDTEAEPSVSPIPPKPKKEICFEEAPVTATEVKPPVFIQPLVDVTVKEKGRAVLQCETTGTPNPVIKWFRNNVQITSSSDYHLTYKDGFCTLVIPEVYPEDSGKFTCTATNIAGTKTTSAHLNVEIDVTSKGLFLLY